MFEFKLPDIGEGVMEGEVVEWHVKTGDAVQEDDPMVEVMTDKATVTIGAPREGTIADIRYQVGETAKVGDVLVVIAVGGSKVQSASTTMSGVAAPTAESAEQKNDDGPAATAVGDIRDGLPGSNFFSNQGKPKPAAPAKSNGGYFAAKPLATPATRKLARDLEVDLRRVKPTGVGGRVTKEDVQAFQNGAPSENDAVVDAEITSAGTQLAQSRAPMQHTVTSIVAPAREDSNLEVRKPFVGIRRKIAERMQQSKNTAAHFTFVEECNVDALIELKNRLAPRAQKRGVKLSFLPFITKAVVAALKKHPILNSALDESTNELVFRNYYHVGVAAATDQGLMVPVVRDADRKSLIGIAEDIERLGTGAREGTLRADELSGSTFTITSLGKQGGLFATPVLNFPEVGILGVHQIKQKPVVRDGEIVVGNVMLLSLSFDHRIVDGHVGAAFAYDIISYLEDPESLLLEA